MIRAAPILGLAALVGGCTTFGTNVKGSFSCQAPDGLCAPSSVIDDRALAIIAGEVAAPVVAPAADLAILRTPALSKGVVARSDQKVLRIVFPAHVDARGRYHEQSVVRALVDPGTWLAAAPPAQPATAAAGEATEVAAAPAPSIDAVLAARARAKPAPLSREALAAEVDTVLGRPVSTNAPASFPARVED